MPAGSVDNGRVRVALRISTWAVAFLACAGLVVGLQQQRHLHSRTAQGAVATLSAMTTLQDQDLALKAHFFSDKASGDLAFTRYSAGFATFDSAEGLVARGADGDQQSLQLVRQAQAAYDNWLAIGRGSLTLHPADSLAALKRSDTQLASFRAVNSALQSRLTQRANQASTFANIYGATLLLLVTISVFVSELARSRRRSRRMLLVSERELAYRANQRTFSELLQATDSEAEAHDLVERHLMKSLPGSTATLLRRNNSDNRLSAARTPPADSALGVALVGAEPRDCLAIRLGRQHLDGTSVEGLLSCRLCGQLSALSQCQPLLVSGKVIGSVMVNQDRAMTDAEQRSLSESVSQAAPVLANLRSLAIAESRAATDTLTGLPNRRAMADVIKRMAAQAGRSGHPLAAIAFDLDHFKEINDEYGHEAGDSALSAVGECVRMTIRSSDFAARIGGEEFVVLAPNTDLEGAQALAEKLRDAFRTENIPQVGRAVTASFGVAVMPDHASSTEALLRRADRASYLAKELGRNRVETGLDAKPAPDSGSVTAG